MEWVTEGGLEKGGGRGESHRTWRESCVISAVDGDRNGFYTYKTRRPPENKHVMNPVTQKDTKSKPKAPADASLTVVTAKPSSKKVTDE